MIYKISLLVVIFICFVQISGRTFAHPGRTDSSGCHTCRTNCPNWGLSYGEYHCHNSKGNPQPYEPIKSHYGEGETGYTTPAPEYKLNTTNNFDNANAKKSNSNNSVTPIPEPLTTQQPTPTEPKKEENEESLITWGIVGIIIYALKKKFFS